MSATRTRLYFDTSAIVPLYVPEVFSNQADKAVRRRGCRIVSALGIAETSAAVRARHRRGDMSLEDAEKSLGKFRQHVNLQFFLVEPVHAEDYARVADLVWSIGGPVRTLDALHLAVVERTRAALVAADDRLLEAAAELGLPVIDLRKL